MNYSTSFGPNGLANSIAWPSPAATKNGVATSLAAANQNADPKPLAKAVDRLIDAAGTELAGMPIVNPQAIAAIEDEGDAPQPVSSLSGNQAGAGPSPAPAVSFPPDDSDEVPGVIGADHPQTIDGLLAGLTVDIRRVQSACAALLKWIDSQTPEARPAARVVSGAPTPVPFAALSERAVGGPLMCHDCGEPTTREWDGGEEYLICNACAEKGDRRGK